MQMPSYISTGLHYQHKSLIDTIDGLTDEQVRRQIIPGKWSIFENIVHLQTYQHLFIVRVQKILATDNPLFPRYTAEADPLFLENCSLTIREIMHDLITTRKEIATEMVQFPEADFLKTGIHSAFGSMNLLQWMNFFLLHEGHHLFTVFKLSSELKKAGSC
jgi:uncharacterized damage-inducible protein DinB